MTSVRRFIHGLALLLCVLAAQAADTPFKLTIDTRLISMGSSIEHQFTLPLRPGFAYDCTVDWGDGTTQALHSAASPTHIYATDGIHTVAISENSPGGFPTIYFSQQGDCGKVVTLSQWGTVRWTTLRNSFGGCRNMMIAAVDSPDTGTVSDFSHAWYDCVSLTGFPLIDTGAGTDFSGAWTGCSGLTSFPLLDTSAGVDFAEAWAGCDSLTSFPLIDTGAGTSFSNTWDACAELTSFPALDTAQGTDFGGAWSNCVSLASFPLLATGRGENFSYAWTGCQGLTGFPLIDTSHGLYFISSWQGCASMTAFPLLALHQAQELQYAWSGCSALTAFPNVDVTSASGLNQTWSGCSALTSFPALQLPAATILSATWSGCVSLTTFPMISIPQVVYLYGTWQGCSGLTSFPLLATSSVLTFESAWQNCSGLTSFPLLSTEQALGFVRTWSGCTSLHDLPALDLRNLSDGTECFHGVSLGVPSYDALLNRMALSTARNHAPFDGGDSWYSQVGASAHDVLTITRDWTITDSGELPFLHSLTEAAAEAGTAFSYQIITEGRVASLTVSDLPAWLSFNPTTWIVSGTAPGTTGTAGFAIIIYSPSGYMFGTTVTVHINAAGAPVITPAGDTVATRVFTGEAFSFPITASHSPTLYSAGNLPSGVTLNNSTGVISGTATTVGTYIITLRAINDAGFGIGRLDLTVATPLVAPTPTPAEHDAGSSCGLGGGVALFVLFGLGVVGRGARRPAAHATRR